jgi:hypothetical protein
MAFAFAAIARVMEGVTRVTRLARASEGMAKAGDKPTFSLG